MKKKKQVEIIADILIQNARTEFCYECLARAADIQPKIVNRCALELINNPFFVRRRGHCQICGFPRTKLLIRYRGMPFMPEGCRAGFAKPS
jgi:hypothetical protein